jgi:hypothetical protein
LKTLADPFHEVEALWPEPNVASEDACTCFGFLASRRIMVGHCQNDMAPGLYQLCDYTTCPQFAIVAMRCKNQ